MTLPEAFQLHLRRTRDGDGLVEALVGSDLEQQRDLNENDSRSWMLAGDLLHPCDFGGDHRRMHDSFELLALLFAGECDVGKLAPIDGLVGSKDRLSKRLHH